MEKYKIPEEYELQKVENQLSPRNKYISPSEFSIGIEVCVFFVNDMGVTFEIEDGHIATADELLHFVVTEKEVGLTTEAVPMFALWFISPYLEVQLKPHHLPFKIRHQWRTLIKKYSEASSKDLDFDEPVLSFQRNVYYSKTDENKIINYRIIELLYEEAKNNVLQGRYPCSEIDYCMLAGLQARIQLGPYNPEIHTLQFFRNKMNQFLPHYAHRSRWNIFKWGIKRKHGVEAKILESFCNISADITAQTLQKDYLQFCWTLPYYGSAFFHGTIYQPRHGLIAVLGNYEKEILIGINEEGVYLISPSENEMLLGLKYEELCWECHKPTDEEDSIESRPCLFLQFTVTENDKNLLKILQVFSKQAVLMDALITTFVNEIKQNQAREKQEKTYVQKRNLDKNILYSNPVDVDEVDMSCSNQRLSLEVLEPLTSLTSSKRQNPYRFPSREDSQIWTESQDPKNILHRFSLVTFNEDGEYIDST